MGKNWPWTDHPHYLALSKDAQKAYTVIRTGGRWGLEVLAEHRGDIRYGLDRQELAAALDELYAANLLKRDDEGVWFDSLDDAVEFGDD
jgi:hypothetical protein